MLFWSIGPTYWGGLKFVPLWYCPIKSNWVIRQPIVSKIDSNLFGRRVVGQVQLNLFGAFGMRDPSTDWWIRYKLNYWTKCALSLPPFLRVHNYFQQLVNTLAQRNFFVKTLTMIFVLKFELLSEKWNKIFHKIKKKQFLIKLEDFLKHSRYIIFVWCSKCFSRKYWFLVK